MTLQQLTPEPAASRATPPGRLNLRVAMSMRAAELTRSSALQSRAAEATAKANAAQLLQSPATLLKTPSLSPDDARAIAEARAAQLQARPSREKHTCRNAGSRSDALFLCPSF